MVTAGEPTTTNQLSYKITDVLSSCIMSYLEKHLCNVGKAVDVHLDQNLPKTLDRL